MEFICTAILQLVLGMIGMVFLSKEKQVFFTKNFLLFLLAMQFGGSFIFIMALIDGFDDFFDCFSHTFFGDDHF